MVDTIKENGREVDPWKFSGSMLKSLLSARIPDEPAHPEIPWTPVTKPLAESRIALLSTAGISMKGDKPFDMEGERQRPSWGDPSWRALRADATSADIEVNHLHIDTGPIERDLNVALPLDRVRELIAAGQVGSLADTHYSTMGYQGAGSKELEEKTAPEIAEAMVADHVDLALLTPV